MINGNLVNFKERRLQNKRVALAALFRGFTNIYNRSNYNDQWPLANVPHYFVLLLSSQDFDFNTTIFVALIRFTTTKKFHLSHIVRVVGV